MSRRVFLERDVCDRDLLLLLLLDGTPCSPNNMASLGLVGPLVVLVCPSFISGVTKSMLRSRLESIFLVVAWLLSRLSQVAFLAPPEPLRTGFFMVCSGDLKRCGIRNSMVSLLEHRLMFGSGPAVKLARLPGLIKKESLSSRFIRFHLHLRGLEFSSSKKRLLLEPFRGLSGTISTLKEWISLSSSKAYRKLSRLIVIIECRLGFGGIARDTFRRINELFHRCHAAGCGAVRRWSLCETIS